MAGTSGAAVGATVTRGLALGVAGALGEVAEGGSGGSREGRRALAAARGDVTLGNVVAALAAVQVALAHDLLAQATKGVVEGGCVTVAAVVVGVLCVQSVRGGDCAVLYT